MNTCRPIEAMGRMHEATDLLSLYSLQVGFAAASKKWLLIKYAVVLLFYTVICVKPEVYSAHCSIAIKEVNTTGGSVSKLRLEGNLGNRKVVSKVFPMMFHSYFSIIPRCFNRGNSGISFFRYCATLMITHDRVV